MDATTIGVDLAKSVFEVAVANGSWRIVVRHRFTRTLFDTFLRDQPPAHVVMEACGTAHYWARRAQGHGHRVTLLPAQYVRPYVRRHKTDRTDAEALLEAIRSGSIPPVTVKTVTQQEVLALHRDGASQCHARFVARTWCRARPRRTDGAAEGTEAA